jgi:hypothetical protein
MWKIKCQSYVFHSGTESVTGQISRQALCTNECFESISEDDIVTCFARQRDNNNVDSPDLTREFIGTTVEITHNRYYTHFRV